MIVDDEPAILRTLKRTLLSWGYAVETASDGDIALSKARQCKPCMVITDLLMPDMDGYELVRKLREEFGDETPPLAVLTGDSRRENLRRQEGVISVLLKPAPLPALRRMVDGACINHRRPPYIVDTVVEDSDGPSVA